MRRLGVMFWLVAAGGCLQSVRDVTTEAIPKCAGIAGKTYTTCSALFLVHDRGDRRSFLFGRDGQDFPYDPAAFTGKEIRVAWGRDSRIADVIEPGTLLRVERIEHVSGVEMQWDRIHGRILTGKHTGRTLQIEDLFDQSDRPEIPIQPRDEYLREDRRD